MSRGYGRMQSAILEVIADIIRAKNCKEKRQLAWVKSVKQQVAIKLHPNKKAGLLPGYGICGVMWGDMISTVTMHYSPKFETSFYRALRSLEKAGEFEFERASGRGIDHEDSVLWIKSES